MINEKEAQSAFNFYFPRLSGCTSFADSIHSVSDLRLHLSIFLSFNFSIFQFFHLSILQFPSFIIAIVNTIRYDDMIHKEQAHGLTGFLYGLC